MNAVETNPLIVPHREARYTYSVYGLCLSSALELPELLCAPASACPDLIVRFGHISRPALPVPEDEEGSTEANGGEAYLYWLEIGKFLVRNGREIIIDPEDGVDVQMLRLYVLGSALGVALHQRGVLALHASAVAMQGGVVAFVGASGAGKSTLAAALHARGHQLLCDDVVALKFVAGQPLVQPGIPQFKLWRESVEALGAPPGMVRQLHGNIDKYAWRVGEGFSAAALPLRCVYLIEEGATLSAMQIGRQDAFFELIHHSYALRFLGAAGATPHHFQQCAQVAAAVPHYQIAHDYQFAHLPNIAALIEHHQESMPS